MLARVTCKFENKKKANVDENLENKNALTAAFSLAWLEIRSRNEGAIDSTRNGFTR